MMRAAFERRGKTMHSMLSAIDGVTCLEPQGAFYCFPDVAGPARPRARAAARARRAWSWPTTCCPRPRWRSCPARRSARPATPASRSPSATTTSSRASPASPPSPPPDPSVCGVRVSGALGRRSSLGARNTRVRRGRGRRRRCLPSRSWGPPTGRRWRRGVASVSRGTVNTKSWPMRPCSSRRTSPARRRARPRGRPDGGEDHLGQDRAERRRAWPRGRRARVRRASTPMKRTPGKSAASPRGQRDEVVGAAASAIATSGSRTVTVYAEPRHRAHHTAWREASPVTTTSTRHSPTCSMAPSTSPVTPPSVAAGDDRQHDGADGGGQRQRQRPPAGRRGGDDEGDDAGAGRPGRGPTARA